MVDLSKKKKYFIRFTLNRQMDFSFGFLSLFEIQSKTIEAGF